MMDRRGEGMSIGRLAAFLLLAALLLLLILYVIVPLFRQDPTSVLDDKTSEQLDTLKRAEADLAPARSEDLRLGSERSLGAPAGC